MYIILNELKEIYIRKTIEWLDNRSNHPVILSASRRISISELAALPRLPHSTYRPRIKHGVTHYALKKALKIYSTISLAPVFLSNCRT